MLQHAARQVLISAAQLQGGKHLYLFQPVGFLELHTTTQPGMDVGMAE